MKELSEKAIEQKLRSGIIRLKGQCLKFVSPSFTGVPDRIILLPGGMIYFVEVKKPSGRVSPVQKSVHALFASLGFPVETLYTEEAVNQFLEKVADADLL